jgi:hypothetical protein
MATVLRAELSTSRHSVPSKRDFSGVHNVQTDHAVETDGLVNGSRGTSTGDKVAELCNILVLSIIGISGATDLLPTMLSWHTQAPLYVLLLCNLRERER